MEVLGPSAFFVSCKKDFPNENLIASILTDSSLELNQKVDPNLTYYPWHIDNKYYTADVYLASLNTNTVELLPDNLEAVIIYFDSKLKSSLKEADTWVDYFKRFEPEIKILVTDNCDTYETEENVSKLSAQEWCIARSYELVELNPIVEEVNEEDLEDDFQETLGVKRIVQALHAHVWPNLNLKSDTPNPRNTDEGFLTDDYLENEEFSALFSQLCDMKEHVSSLSGDLRKEAAEKIVKDFIKVLGLDDEVESDSSQ